MSGRRHLDDEQQLRWHLGLHLCAYVLNAIVPLWYGMMAAEDGESGFVLVAFAAVVALTLLGVRAAGRRLRPEVFRDRSRSCLIFLFVFAVTQFLPILQLALGVLAMSLTGWDLDSYVVPHAGHLIGATLIYALPYCAFVALCFWPWSRRDLRPET